MTESRCFQRAGYDTARDPKVHMNVVTVWRSRLFGGSVA